MSKQILAFTAVAGLALGASAFAAAPQPPVSSDMRITLDARGVPLGKLLRQFAVLAHVEELTIDPSLEGVLVSVKLDGVTPAEAFRAALADAGADFAIVGTGSDLRIVAHGLKRSGPDGARSASAAATDAPPAKAEFDAMKAVLKGTQAVDEAETASQDNAAAADAPESHADPVAAFLGKGGMGDAAAAPAPTVSSPGEAVPLTMPASSNVASAGKSSPAPAAAPADLPTDPFARYLTVMSATKPPKQQ